MRRTMKKTISILLAVIMIIAYMPVMAFAETETVASGTCGKNLTWELDSNGVLTISGTGEMYNYYSGAPWYEQRALIKEVVISDGVTSIGSWAFENCTSLVNITIPGSVNAIDSSAFNNCISLKTATISDGVRIIGTSAFRNCGNLKNITIPDSVTSIGGNAFSYCNSLTSITIPGSVNTIEDSVFKDCISLRSVILEKGVISIGDSAFEACSSLESVTIPDGVTSIGFWAFENCTSLVNITIPGSVNAIDSSAFNNCISLKTATISDGVRIIGTSAFQNCINLENITIPNSVTCIGDDAFSYCRSLSELTIPGSVNTIGDSVFKDCISLRSVILEKGVISIGNFTFEECSSLESVTIPDSVASIGYNVFRVCGNLKYVFYTGDENKWRFLTEGSNNEVLGNVAIHYNATDHTWSDVWTIDKKPTTKPGSKSHHCIVEGCDAKKDVTSIPAIVLNAPTTASATLTTHYSKTSGFDDVKFTWSKVKNATGYAVYYKKASASKYNKLGYYTGTTAYKKDLADGVKYIFKVVPYVTVDGTKYEASTSTSKTASVYTLKKLATPTITRSGTKVKVKWVNIYGESGYQISKSTTKTGTNIISTYATTTGTYKLISATKGKTYYYKVRAYKTVDGKKIYGPWSSVKAFKR